MSADALPQRTVWLGNAGAINGSFVPLQYIEPTERDLLAQAVELPYSVWLTAAERTIAQHTHPVVVTEGRPDPHARWRNLVRRAPGRGEATTYRRSTCLACANDGSCAVLDAARIFAEVIGPYVAAEETST